MGRYDHECELCEREARTVCIGAMRLCRRCAEEKLYDLNVGNYTAKRTYNDLDDCALECGNYYNLISMIYCLGRITECDVEGLVEGLDKIFDDMCL